MNYDWGKDHLAYASHHNEVLGLILIMKYEENNNEVMKRDAWLYFINKLNVKLHDSVKVF